MNLLVGIPALNEAATIRDVIARIPRVIEGVDEVTVVVIDDGSTDGTGDLAREAGATVVRHPQNSGVGVAFQTMVRHALAVRADMLVTLDGDGQFNPEDIAKLIAPIVEGKALVCTASRFRDAALVPTMPWVKKWGNRQVANLVNMLTGHRYADVSCGFRAYHREALLRLTVYHSFTYTHETFLDLAAKKVPIVEVPLVVRGVREFGKSKLASSVLRYGARTAKIMLLTYRDQAPLRLCAWMGVPLVAIGVILLAWSFWTLEKTGFWLKWAAFAGGAAIGCAILALFFGFMADIATRLRRNQEEILYWLRRGVVDVPPRVRATAQTSAAAPSPSEPEVPHLAPRLAVSEKRT
jgi:glycosyltransferase involved in cell wall biosynthesis